MAIVVDTRLISILYCVLKQAERSIHPALCPGHWPLMQNYYDAVKQNMLVQTLAKVKMLLPKEYSIKPCTYFSKFSFGSLLFAPIRQLINRHRTRWRIAVEELAFLVETGTLFLNALASTIEPQNHELYQIKVDLYVSVWMLERQLIGLPILRQLCKVEHYCPSIHQECIPLGELLKSIYSDGIYDENIEAGLEAR